MGEYAIFKGEQVKLGTCENLYYVRYDFLKNNLDKFSRSGSNLEPKEFLNNGFRFRFPFPEEDKEQPFNYENFDKGLSIPAEKEFIQNIEHEKICVHVKTKSGGYGINYFIPCPASKEETEIEHSPIETLPLEVVQLKPMGTESDQDYFDEVWLIVRCGYCGTKVRLDHKEAERLTKHIQSLYPGVSYWLEVCCRILKGYC